MPSTCEIINYEEVTRDCATCREFEKMVVREEADTATVGGAFMQHVARSHSKESSVEFFTAIREGKSHCRKCITLFEKENLLRERDERARAEALVSKLVHAYEIHGIPHWEIVGTENYFKSVTEISRFTNPLFTKALKEQVRRRANHTCKCCGRTWEDVSDPSEETLYFEKLNDLYDESFGHDDFPFSSLANDTLFNGPLNFEAGSFLGSLREQCKKCRAILRVTYFSSGARIKPSQWFQVHHKNYCHFDNRLGNLEYLCGNCHGERSKWDMNKDAPDNHGIDYARIMIDYMKSRGIMISYVLLQYGIFQWAVIGERGEV
jgi:hypothetical protein